MAASRRLGIESNAIDQVLVCVVPEFLGTVSKLAPRRFGQETVCSYKCVFRVICLYDRDKCGECCAVQQTHLVVASLSPSVRLTARALVEDITILSGIRME